MDRDEKKEVELPCWLSKVFQIAHAGRYYPNDERPPLEREFSIKGPMLRVALDHGKKAWHFTKDNRRNGSEITISGVRELIASGKYDKCSTWPKVWFPDVSVHDGGLGVWTLWKDGADLASDGRIEILAPSYPELMKIKAEEARQRGFAKSVRDPKTPPRDIKTRGDTL